MNTCLNILIRYRIGILLAVMLPFHVAQANAHTADGAIIERTETGKWSVVIPSSRQISTEESIELPHHMRERLRVE